MRRAFTRGWNDAFLVETKRQRDGWRASRALSDRLLDRERETHSSGRELASLVTGRIAGDTAAKSLGMLKAIFKATLLPNEIIVTIDDPKRRK